MAYVYGLCMEDRTVGLPMAREGCLCLGIGRLPDLLSFGQGGHVGGFNPQNVVVGEPAHRCANLLLGLSRIAPNNLHGHAQFGVVRINAADGDHSVEIGAVLPPGGDTQDLTLAVYHQVARNLQPLAGKYGEIREPLI